jgi:hypothetical protein
MMLHVHGSAGCEARLEHSKEGDMTSTGLQEGDVIRVDQAIHGVPEFPDGLAFLVQDFLGWADPGRAVWARGVVVDRRIPGAPSLVLRIPVTDARASLSAPRTSPANPVTESNPSIGENAGLVGPPPGYARRVFDTAKHRFTPVVADSP